VKILLVTGNFAAPGVNPWLLDDLAEAFADAGHEVDVIVHSATAPRPRGVARRGERVRVLSVGATSAPRSTVAKLRSYIGTAARLHTTGARFAAGATYDLAVYTSIAAFSFGFPARMRRRGTARRLLFVMWDFFPVHQIEIGRIRPAGMAPLLKLVERLSIRRADVIAVMSPANERYLSSYHRDLPARVVHVPPWASVVDLPDPPRAKRDRFTAIFGGQLVKGRGVDTLLEASRILEDEGRAVDILIAGDGPAAPALRDRAAALGLDHVEFLGSLARDDYRDLLQSAHVGVAVTVSGISPPSFPSKIIEYCTNAVPVVVCVEAASDAGEFIAERGAGLAVSAGDARALADALSQLLAEHERGELAERGRIARSVFLSELSVERAAATMTAAADATGGDETRS
jgi:glycosyltransferase involved in cell wall biosynthesis